MPTRGSKFFEAIQLVSWMREKTKENILFFFVCVVTTVLLTGTRGVWNRPTFCSLLAACLPPLFVFHVNLGRWHRPLLRTSWVQAYHKVEDTNSLAIICQKKNSCNNVPQLRCLSKWQNNYHEHAYLMLSFRRRAFLLLHFGVTIKVCELYVLLRTCTGWGGPGPLCSSFKLTLLKSSAALAAGWHQRPAAGQSQSHGRTGQHRCFCSSPVKIVGLLSRSTLAQATPWPWPKL